MTDDAPLFPTPKAHDGVFGRPRTSGRPIERSTHLGTIVTLLPMQEFDDGDGTPLLPTPTASLAEHRRDNGADPDKRRARGKQVSLADEVCYLPGQRGEPLLPTPTQSDGTGGGIRTGLSWDGTTKPTGNGGNSRLRDVVGLFVDDDTQETAMTEAPKTRPDTASGPTLQQAVDLTQGMLPLEFDDWDEVPDEWRPLVKDGPGMARPETTDPRADWVVDPDDAVFPTPSAADGHRGGTDPEKTKAAGHRVKLIDAVLGDDLKGDPDPLFPAPNADQGRGTRTPDAVQRRIDKGDEQISLEDSVALLPTPTVGASLVRNSPGEMARAHPALGAVIAELAEQEYPLLPTPVSRDHKGRTNTRDPEKVTTRGDYLPDAVYKMTDDPLLPTPRAGASDGMATTPEERRTKGQSVSLSEAVGAEMAAPLFPTPVAQDGNGHMQDLSADVGNNGRSVSLGDVAARLPEGEGPLLPTPKTHQRGDCPSERERNSPDLAAATHHFPAGRWGKYGPAVARWEALTRPAPAPTEPNKNGNPRLTARFSEWLIGWPEGWVTDPEIGVSRTGQLRIVGNGVVPQQAYAAIAMLLKNLDHPEPQDDAV